jgi:hypothetical protein
MGVDMSELFGIHWELGLMLSKRVRNDPCITYFQEQKNKGWANLRMCPFRTQKIGKLFVDPYWQSFEEFKCWLSEHFKDYDDGTYYLQGWSSQKHYCKKVKRKVRHFVPFVKFEIYDGRVEIPPEYKTTSKGRTYKVFLLALRDEYRNPEREKQLEEYARQLGLGRSIKF